MTIFSRGTWEVGSTPPLASGMRCVYRRAGLSVGLRPSPAMGGDFTAVRLCSKGDHCPSGLPVRASRCYIFIHSVDVFAPSHAPSRFGRPQ